MSNRVRPSPTPSREKSSVHMRNSINDRETTRATAPSATADTLLWKRLSALGRPRGLEKREVLISSGDEIRHLYLIARGAVTVTRSENGREAAVAICGVGDMVGECGLFLAGTFPFSARAAEASTVLAVDRADVMGLMAVEPSFHWALCRISARHFRDACHLLADDRTLTALQRTSRYLLDVWVLSGSPAAFFQLPYRKAVLAARLGVAPEALSRALSDLRGYGVLVNGQQVRISDPEALRAIQCAPQLRER
jgi:CRP/FNR family transcriptional regulator, dissimilatory nitrate respiration regulator